MMFGKTWLAKNMIEKLPGDMLMRRGLNVTKIDF